MCGYSTSKVPHDFEVGRRWFNLLTALRLDEKVASRLKSGVMFPEHCMVLEEWRASLLLWVVQALW